jgi:endonuclease III
MYGTVAWKRHGRGLDVLIEAMLAQNTSMINATRGFRRLRRAFPTWNKVLHAPVEDVQRQIAVCGLARMRARRLQSLLTKVRADQGKLDLDLLAEMEVEAAYDYLMSFHGIGPRSAAFTLLFAFNSAVLPVDNGILRVIRRLRLVRRQAREREVERTLLPWIRRGGHYAAHVLLFRHAKERCRPKNPKCDECRLVEVCPFGKRRVRHQPPVEPIERPKRLARVISDGLKKVGSESDGRL